MKILQLLAFLSVFINIQAQTDPAAMNVLDQFSSKALAAPSVSMNFLLLSEDQIENTTDTLKGSVIISGNKYRLELPDNIVWFDGKTSWSYLPAEKEVTVTTPGNKKDDAFRNNPSAVFTAYKKGYKTRLIDETADSYLVDLYPEDIKSDIVRLRITIGKQLADLKSFEYKTKEGMVYMLRVTSYSLAARPDPGTFTFQADKYRDADIIDMR